MVNAKITVFWDVTPLKKCMFLSFPLACSPSFFFSLSVIYHVFPSDWSSTLEVYQAIYFETSAKLHGVASRNCNLHSVCVECLCYVVIKTVYTHKRQCERWVWTLRFLCSLLYIRRRLSWMKLCKHYLFPVRTTGVTHNFDVALYL